MTATPLLEQAKIDDKAPEEIHLRAEHWQYFIALLKSELKNAGVTVIEDMNGPNDANAVHGQKVAFASRGMMFYQTDLTHWVDQILTTMRKNGHSYFAFYSLVFRTEVTVRQTYFTFDLRFAAFNPNEIVKERTASNPPPVPQKVA